MDYTVRGILQARILEWVAFPFSRGSSQPREWTQVSHIAGGFFTQLSHREAKIVKYPSKNPLCTAQGMHIPIESLCQETNHFLASSVMLLKFLHFLILVGFCLIKTNKKP